MRITNKMISNNYLSALNGSLERQSKIQEQLADGKAVHRPSDDPIKTIRSMRFNTSLAMNEQYTQNLADSQSWMDNTDGAMNSLDSVMIRVKELVISADGTKPPDALNAIGLEVDQLINQAITIGNAKVGDRYLFAGQMDKIQPFERKTIKDPTNPSGPGMDVVVYNGDANKISMQIKPGAINANEDGINVIGSELFGPLKTIYGQPTMEIFNQLIAIKQELQGGPRQVPVVPGVAGAVNVKGTYTGKGVTYFDVRIDSTAGGTSTNNLNMTSPLTTQFADVSVPFNLTINGGSSVAINPATDTMTTLLSKMKTAGGLTDAQCDPLTGKVTLTGVSDFEGSDANGLAFLNKQLKLSTVNTITTTSSVNISTGTQFLGTQFPGLPASFNLKINGNPVPVTVNSSTDTISSLLTAIKAAGTPRLTDAQYDSVTGKITLTGSSDFSGSDTAGLTFLHSQLGLPTVNATTTTTSSGDILTATGLNTTAKFLDKQFSGLSAPFSLVVNGDTVVVDPTTATISSLLTAIKATGAPLTDAQYDSATGKITLTGTSDFSLSDPAGLSFLNDKLKLPTTPTTNATSSGNILDPLGKIADQFSITTPFQLTLTNGGLSKTVKFDPANPQTDLTAADSLSSFVANINSAGVNANASYDAVTGKFTLQATSGTLDFTGSDPAALSFLTDNLHMPSPSAGKVQIASYSTDGGNTWQAASVMQGIKPGDPSTLTLSNGMSVDIAENTGNKAGGTYNFRMPAGTETDWLSRVGLANVDAAHSTQLRQHTQLGARMATYEMAKNMMEDANVTIIENVSKNEDIDISTVVVQQKANENLYNAALSVGAKLMPMSLVDFLK